MMMAAAHHTEPLIARLPAVRGRLTENAPLHRVTWFRVGGPAEVLFRPEDPADLRDFLVGCPGDIPLTVLGVGSNLLVRDGGVPGVVIRLTRAFNAIEPEGTAITAGAGALDANIAKTAQQRGIGGLAFLAGVPGSMGGALRMNAGAYGTEIRDVLSWAEAIHRDGTERRFAPDELGFGYRHCGLSASWIFTRARLQGHAAASDAIAAEIASIQQQRGDSQPIRTRTSGSTFKNPPGMKAWQLVDQAGCRGLRVGGAMVSEQHTNFLINTGDATAHDIETLGETVRRRVLETSGVELAWEIRRVGVAASAPDSAKGDEA